MATGLEQESVLVFEVPGDLDKSETLAVTEITAQDYIDAYYQYKDDELPHLKCNAN